MKKNFYEVEREAIVDTNHDLLVTSWEDHKIWGPQDSALSVECLWDLKTGQLLHGPVCETYPDPEDHCYVYDLLEVKNKGEGVILGTDNIAHWGKFLKIHVGDLPEAMLDFLPKEGEEMTELDIALQEAFVKSAEVVQQYIRDRWQKRAVEKAIKRHERKKVII